MAEVNLIPADFRSFKELKKKVRLFIVSYLALVCVAGGGKVWIEYIYTYEKKQLENLKTEENSILEKRRVFDELNAQKIELEKYHGKLASLRGGPKAEHMFVVLDKSINDQVWISTLKFFRAGENEPQSTVKKTYSYLILPQENTSNSQWENQVRMDVKGQALDHSALADFVNMLHDQREVADVKIKNTRIMPFMKNKVIAFDLSIKVNTEQKG